MVNEGGLPVTLAQKRAQKNSDGKGSEEPSYETAESLRAGAQEPAVAQDDAEQHGQDQDPEPTSRDPPTAVLLNDLALLYYTQGHYAQAEPLYRRSLAIWEKALGLEHPDVATVLENYAALLRETTRADETEKMKLFGNVGYRLIEANVKELLRSAPEDKASWC